MNEILISVKKYTKTSPKIAILRVNIHYAPREDCSGRRGAYGFDKFRQAQGLHRLHSEPCACSMRETHHPVPEVLPTFNANTISDLTLPPYTKTVKRKI